jgi:hypothetical protein
VARKELRRSLRARMGWWVEVQASLPGSWIIDWREENLDWPDYVCAARMSSVLHFLLELRVSSQS